ncbi:hypothetical protein AAG570_009896 [Ranatra chinensis]|uniref:Uncharacterized protein n=1 Tax=Ranatra chinensis TaxID=642074 RepID=A0ABD0YQP6_9HEMI
MASKRRNMLYENKKQETTEIDLDNLPHPIDAQLGLDQLEDIYHEVRENLKLFLTAPESVESFREEEMFPLSDRLYAEYYAISKYLRRAVSAVDSKPFTTSEPGIRNPTSFDLSIASIPKLANLDSPTFQNLTTNERWDKLSCNVACVSLLASAEHNPVRRNAPAYPMESHDPVPATLLFLSGDRDSVDHSPDSQDPPIKLIHRSLDVEETPLTKVLQLSSLGSASEEFSLKPNDQTSKPPDELLETAPESPGIPLITTPESYSLNSISSWPRRFRIVATILARRSRNRSKPHSTRSCVWHAEIAVCQHIQQSRFAPQLNQTQAGKPLSKSWVRLSPLISDDGLIRAGGRSCLHSPSCPILLSNDHPLVLALTVYLYVFFSQAGPLLFYFNLSGL